MPSIILDALTQEEQEKLQKIRALIHKITNKPAWDGYEYLAYAVQWTKEQMLQGHYLSQHLTKELYPLIGNIYKKSPAAVSKALDRAAADFWKNGDQITLRKITGIAFSEKPSPGQLISQLACYFVEREYPQF